MKRNILNANTINFSKAVGFVKIEAKERAGFSRPRKPKQSEQWKQRPKRSSDSNKSDNASFYEDNDCENGYTYPHASLSCLPLCLLLLHPGQINRERW